MKSISLAGFFSLFSIMLNGQMIESLSVSDTLTGSIEVDLTVVEGSGMGYIIHSVNIENNVIDLTVCYWVDETTVVSSIDNEFFIPIEQGSIDYTLNVNIYQSFSQDTCDFNELTDTATLSFSTPLSDTIYLATYENEFIDEIKIYPNPSNDFLNIETYDDLQILSITIFNLLGSKIIELTGSPNKIDLSSIDIGVYLLKIETNKGVLTKQLIKE
jgi:hypothetical protein